MLEGNTRSNKIKFTESVAVGMKGIDGDGIWNPGKAGDRVSLLGKSNLGSEG